MREVAQKEWNVTESMWNLTIGQGKLKKGVPKQTTPQGKSENVIGTTDVPHALPW